MSFKYATVLLLSLSLSTTLVSGNNPYGGASDDADDDTIEIQPHSSAQPQPQSGGGSGGDKYWWMMNNPFQKPAGHPGVERGDDAGAPAPSRQRPAAASHNQKPQYQQQHQYSGGQQGSNSYGFEQPNQNLQPAVPAAGCLLRNQADCHGGSQQPSQPQAYPQEPYFEPQQQQPPQYTPVSTPYTQPSFQGGRQPQAAANQQSKPPRRPFPHVKPYSEESSKPQQQQQPTNNNFNNYQPQEQGGSPGGEEDQVPYPGCPAAMLCVPETFCDPKGVSQGKPLQLSAAEKRFRVALMACSMEMGGEEGVCCRDPDYQDPWPNMQGGGNGGGGKFDDGQYHGSGPTNNQPQANNNNNFNALKPQPQHQPAQYFQNQQQPQPFKQQPQGSVSGYSASSGGGCNQPPQSQRPSY